MKRSITIMLALLLLLKGIDVLTREVLVHEHVVLEELEACGAGHHDAPKVVFGIKSDGEQVSQIACSAVVGHDSSIVTLLGCVGIAALLCPLITGREVEANLVGRDVDASPACG